LNKQYTKRHDYTDCQKSFRGESLNNKGCRDSAGGWRFKHKEEYKDSEMFKNLNYGTGNVPVHYAKNGRQQLLHE